MIQIRGARRMRARTRTGPASAIAPGLAATVALLLAGSADAAGPRAEVGEWEMTSTMRNSMLPEPQSATMKQCLDNPDFDPKSFMSEAEGCSVSDVTSSSNSMSWTMVCAAQGTQMTGKGQLQTSAGGKKVSGSMKMSASFNGQTMDFSTEWSGRWLGPCP